MKTLHEIDRGGKVTERPHASVADNAPTPEPEDTSFDYGYNVHRRIPLGNGCYRVLAAPASE